MILSCLFVTKARCLKVAVHDVGLTLSAPQIRAYVSHPLVKIFGTLSPQVVGLRVLVEKLVDPEHLGGLGLLHASKYRLDDQAGEIFLGYRCERKVFSSFPQKTFPAESEIAAKKFLG